MSSSARVPRQPTRTSARAPKRRARTARPAVVGYARAYRSAVARRSQVMRRSVSTRATQLPSRLRPGSRVLRAARPVVAPEVLQARVALLGLYALLGITVASWLSRLPSVLAALGLSAGGLGGVLLAGALASLVTVLVAGGIAERWGNKRTMVVAAWVYAAAALALGLGPALGSVAVLAGGVVAMSVSFALGNVPLNVESVRIERAMGRTVVPQFHAAFSLGSVLGSALGALAAWGHLSLAVHFAAVAVLSLVWRLRAIPAAVLPPVLPAPAGPSGASGTSDPAPVRRGGGLRESLSAWRDRRTLLVGVVVMAGALSEGTANTWLAIGVVDGFAAREAIGALVFGTFVAAMTVARLGGTALIDRFGRAPVLVVSMSLAVVGLVGYGLAPSLAGAVLGTVAWGLGAGLVVPIAMSSATGDGLGAAGRVAVVSAFGSVANLAAPPLIGLAADQIGVRHAVLGSAVVMVAGVLLARRATAGPTLRQDVAVPAAVPVPVPASAAGRR